jgi:tetratricopeptide (TPR) repeat protein
MSNFALKYQSPERAKKRKKMNKPVLKIKNKGYNKMATKTKQVIALFLLLALTVSCGRIKEKANESLNRGRETAGYATEGQPRPDNTKPMYGEVPKEEQYRESDEKFIKDCLEQFGSIDSAVVAHLDFAWNYFYHNDLTTAMKRFNQAWLLNPEFPDAYFGFAALLEVQKTPDEAARFYKMGMEKDSHNQRAEICYRKIADCKKEISKKQ